MNQTLSNAREGIIKEIIDSGAYDRNKIFINIDKIWEKPDKNEKFCSHLIDYITITYPLNEISGIITLDSIAFPYGPIPLATLISTKLNLPLGIVKEGDDPISGRHMLYGQGPLTNTLFLYDVIRFGLTAIRIIKYLTSQGIKPKWFLTIVDCGQGGIKFLSETTFNEIKIDCDFNAIIKLEDIVLYDQRKI